MAKYKVTSLGPMSLVLPLSIPEPRSESVVSYGTCKDWDQRCHYQDEQHHFTCLCLLIQENI